MKKELTALLGDYVKTISDRNDMLDEKQKTLEGELNKVKVELDKIKIERLEFKEKLLRAKAYQINSGVCPICFIEYGLSATFKPIPSNTKFDNFKCSNCNHLLLDVEA